MTDTLDQQLADIVVGPQGLLRQDPGLTVFDGVVPNPTPSPPYVLVYTHIDWPDGAPGDAVDGVSGSATIRWICHQVGGNELATRAVAQRVRTQLLNVRPNPIPGMSLGLIKQESSVPPTRDESTGVAVMDAVTTYRLLATT